MPSYYEEKKTSSIIPWTLTNHVRFVSVYLCAAGGWWLITIQRKRIFSDEKLIFSLDSSTTTRHFVFSVCRREFVIIPRSLARNINVTYLSRYTCRFFYIFLRTVLKQLLNIVLKIPVLDTNACKHISNVPVILRTKIVRKVQLQQQH